MKTKTKFTPGIWHINGEYVEDTRGNPICRVMGSAPYNQEWLKKIAAAPSLYEALSKLVTIVGGYDNGQMLPTPIVVAAQEAQAALALVEKGGGCE